MKNINFSKDILPHLVALIIFLIITILLFSPMIFGNQSLGLHDVQQGLGGGQEAREYRQATGEEPLWTNSMFGGMPTYLINTDWGDGILWKTYKILSFGLPSPAGLVLLSMISFYLLLMIAGVRPWVGILGAIGFSLSSFVLISIGAGHIWKIRAVAFAPLVIAGFYLLFYRNKLLWGFILTAFALTFQIWSNHLQITYYLMLLMIIFGSSTLYYAIKERAYKRFFTKVGMVALATILAIAANLDRLWCTYEYGQYSTRGKSELTNITNAKSGLDKDYVFNWSHGIVESFTLMIPYFYGGASQEALDKDSHVAQKLQNQGANSAQITQTIQNMPTYWGNQPFVGGPIYAGAIVCFLFVLAIVILPYQQKTWLIAGVVLSLMLAWGSNFSSFNYLMYDIFPGYNKFRAVSMAIIIALWCMPLLGALGLEKLMAKGLSNQSKKQLLIAIGVTGGVCLLLSLFSGAMSYSGAVDSQLPDWLVPAIKADRQSLLRGDAFRSLAFILASATVIYLMLNNKINQTIGGGLLVFLLFIDLFMVDKRYFNSDKFTKNANRSYFAMTDADKHIKKDEGNYRVLNLLNPWNEARTSYHHKSLGGYHGAKLKRTQELIDHCLGKQVTQSVNTLRNNSTDFSHLSLLNMLNTKYLVFGGNKENVVSNNAACDNAWLAKKVTRVNNPDEELNATCALSSPFEAVIDKSKFDIPDQIAYDSSSYITLSEYQPNKLTYKSNIINEKSKNSALAIFSEIYYPKGWKATIDGKDVDILRANYVLRAIVIPPGEHTIVFSFRPNAYIIGYKIANASSIILLLLLLGSIVFTIKKTL